MYADSTKIPNKTQIFCETKQFFHIQLLVISQSEHFARMFRVKNWEMKEKMLSLWFGTYKHPFDLWSINLPQRHAVP